MTELAERLRDELKAYPQTRDKLTYILNTNDRALRQAVNELRKEGVPVCSNSGVSGYWIGNNEDIQHTVADLKSRAYDLLAQANGMEGELAGQVEWRL